MTTLEGNHPLIAIRTRSRQPASLLSVMVIAFVTLAIAVGVALITDDNASTPAPATLSADPGASVPSISSGGVLTPRVTEIPARPADVPPGARYDGGPEEGTRGSSSVAAQESHPHYNGSMLLPGTNP